MTLYTPRELVSQVGARAKALRLAQGIRQEDLARSAGVSVATLKRFEATGQATFEVVTRIAVALRAEPDFNQLFHRPPHRSLDEVLGRSVNRQRALRRVR
jgi:transcriptional regulator with XRE-family HTH domain